ncbi:porin [Noviherbaspirillum saxi]|uniref:Porin n=2 Tax=Noviherbaspirillum saxi TaxID=2320863 RepID=A0A3A3FML4_9BURK|nr:porin [Noviherbaspirillum saxi]RJF97432.1 porin [Noviherbaspirillum saxi]
MKMKLCVAAVGCLFGGAVFAQTNVAIYGLVDAGIEYLDEVPKAAGGSGSLVRLASGNLSGSRWGLRGSEDLGNGLKAVMQLEGGFETDTGMLGQSGRLFGRHAYVGLQGAWGTVSLGHQQNSLYDLIIRYDPMSFASRYSALTHDSTLTGRPDNTIKYTGKFSNLTATAFYSFGRNNDGEVPGESKVSRNIGGGVSYSAGAADFGIAYDQFQGNTVATKDQSARRLAAGANYTFGPVKAFAGYRSLKDTVAAAPVRSNLYWAGLKYKLTPALDLTGAGYYTDRKNSGADPWSFVLSADYSLSKRTDAYTTLGYAGNKNGSNLGLNGFGSNIVAGEDQLGLVVGIRHRF